MSGAYGNRFLATRYCWHAERTVRKIFKDDEQARHYHLEHDRAAKGRFLAARSKWEAALADLDPFDPFREGTLVDVSAGDAWIEKIELTTKPGADVDAIRAALKAAAPKFEGEGTAEFRNPVAAVKWGETFGLYVGLTAECTADVALALEPRLRSLLDKLWPIAEAKTRELKFKRPVAKLLEKLDPVRAFNPWGPLSDERFMRETCEVGSVAVRIAFAPDGQDRFWLKDWFGAKLT